MIINFSKKRNKNESNSMIRIYKKKNKFLNAKFHIIICSKTLEGNMHFIYIHFFLSTVVYNVDMGDT